MKSVVVRLHPQMADTFQNSRRRELAALEEEFGIRIDVKASPVLERLDEDVQWTSLSKDERSERREEAAVEAVELMLPASPAPAPAPVARPRPERGPARSDRGPARGPAAKPPVAQRAAVAVKVPLDDEDAVESPAGGDGAEEGTASAAGPGAGRGRRRRGGRSRRGRGGRKKAAAAPPAES
jgi:hypothetical protein